MLTNYQKKDTLYSVRTGITSNHDHTNRFGHSYIESIDKSTMRTPAE